MRQLGAIIGCGLAAAVLGGCGGTSVNYPLDKQLVWRASVAEAMVWRPKIYEEEYRVISERSDLAGNSFRYELKVRRNPNPFARRPSTRVTVSMEQTAPSRRRFVGLEEEFLQSLKAMLVQLTTQPQS
jgi:hypothetical protein